MNNRASLFFAALTLCITQSHYTHCSESTAARGNPQNPYAALSFEKAHKRLCSLREWYDTGSINDDTYQRCKKLLLEAHPNLMQDRATQTPSPMRAPNRQAKRTMRRHSSSAIPGQKALRTRPLR
jgi:hypothetical protein